MKEYKTHSKGDNWIHFRSNMESACEAFTVIFSPDGTVCMTGDYGTLCWKRNYPFTSSNKNLDYGFPGEETNIDYFAEKVCQFGIEQKIKDWEEDRAKKEVEKELLDMFDISKEEADSYFNHEITELSDEKFKVMEFLDGCLFRSQSDMYSKLEDLERDTDRNFDFWEYRFGEDYTAQFKFMFECLQSVSDIICNEFKNK